MGRWDSDRDNRSFRYSRPGGGRWSNARTIRRIIFLGFAVLGVIMLAFFIPRAGLHVNIHQREEAFGRLTTISVQISNNSFDTLHNVTVQFGDDGPIQSVGDLGPFSGILVSPEGDNFDFEKIILTANDGSVSVVKFR